MVVPVTQCCKESSSGLLFQGAQVKESPNLDLGHFPVTAALVTLRGLNKVGHSGGLLSLDRWVNLISVSEDIGFKCRHWKGFFHEIFSMEKALWLIYTILNLYMTPKMASSTFNL